MQLQQKTDPGREGGKSERSSQKSNASNPENNHQEIKGRQHVGISLNKPGKGPAQ